MNETDANPVGPAAATETHPPAGTDVGNVMKVSDAMVGLTWLAFLIACFALYKLAWKPICQALDRREDKIRRSLKEAADVQARAAMDREAQKLALEEARRGAAAIVERARTAAEATARELEAKSRAETTAQIREAQAEIARAREQALGQLRQEAGELALQVAGRILERKLDADADRALADRLIREME